ncbi:hypothetical protein BJY16_006037 [Actinoplanes octamycinicus]|uniref:Uncharacterized protein n=1 Tax=Actinoplanes octamycinicus TaxID=135948 RepID=A0A7W7MA05_9ACTN|nr:hypothetical protein [Actinoplanes octamycinicus]
MGGDVAAHSGFTATYRRACGVLPSDSLHHH